MRSRGRRTVEIGAHLLERVEVAAIVVLGPLEHDVLEEMREAGAPGLFVLGADVVPDVDGGDGERVVLVDDDFETVGQRQLFEGDRDHVNSWCRLGDRGHRRDAISIIAFGLASSRRPVACGVRLHRVGNLRIIYTDRELVGLIWA